MRVVKKRAGRNRCREEDVREKYYEEAGDVEGPGTVLTVRDFFLDEFLVLKIQLYLLKMALYFSHIISSAVNLKLLMGQWLNYNTYFVRLRWISRLQINPGKKLHT